MPRGSNLAVWLLAILFVVFGIPLLLYVRPSFPNILIIAYFIEVFVYVNLYIYSRKLLNTYPPEHEKAKEIFQMEHGT